MRYTGLGFFSVLVFIAVMATVLPLFAWKQWYFRIFDYPRLQTLFIAVAAFIWFAFRYFKKGRNGFIAMGLLLIVIGVQCYKAFPYTPLGAKQVMWSEKDAADTTVLSLLISNVLQTNTAYHKVIEQVNAYKPDIIITTETNQAWERELSVLEKQYPYAARVPQENTYGMHLYSKLPLGDVRVRYLISDDIPSIRSKVQLRSGEWIHLFVLHPRPPVPTEDDDSKQRDAEIILVGKEARKEKGGVIVAGDFNDVAWSETTELFQEVTGYLDPRRGRGFYNTFHAGIPVFRWPLDHIFHSDHFKLVNIRRLENIDSDHFPMFVKLSYEPSEKGDQQKVKKESDTEEKANETIQKGRQEKDPGE